MQGYEAKSVALGAAANLSADGISTAKSQVSAAIAYLTGMTDKATFLKKCVKNLLYARLVMFAQTKPAEFDSDAFCALHKTLFDSKPKCGEIRSEDLTISGGSCTDYKLIRGSLKNALNKLREINGAPGISKADFAASLCCYIRELIILSPFSYGNGVTRRAFIQSFCLSRGFSLSYASVSKKDLQAAEIAAFAADDPQPLFTVTLKCLNYIVESSSSQRSAARAALSLKTTRETSEIAASSKQQIFPPEQKKLPAREKQDAVKDLREIQKTLLALSAKVNEVIKSLENE